MGEVFEKFRNGGLTECAAYLLSSLESCRIAILVHGDYSDERMGRPLVAKCDFTEELDKLSAFSKRLRVSHTGCDWPECYELMV